MVYILAMFFTHRRGRVCLPEPAVTTLGVMHKVNRFRAGKPRPYQFSIYSMITSSKKILASCPGRT
jgi:hypothetical protein